MKPAQAEAGSQEQAFSVYEPYCVNFLAASDLAVGLAKQENSPLSVSSSLRMVCAHRLIDSANQRVSHILDPAELAMFHIKPVQRLLKYHLLFEVGGLFCERGRLA